MQIINSSLYGVLTSIPDHRDPRGRRYPLTDIIILVVAGNLCKQKSMTSIALWAKMNAPFFKKLGIMSIPSHDTMSRAMAKISPESLLNCFILWIERVSVTRNDHIIFDGKAVRAAASRVDGEKPQYIIGAFSDSLSAYIAQHRVGDKSNEITDLPRILDLVSLEDNVVTIDAIGTQHKIMDKIIGNGGDFVLPVKGNQKFMESNVSDFFDGDYTNDDYDREESFEKGHGRIEKRIYEIINLPGGASIEGWEHVRAVGKVTRDATIIKYGVPSEQRSQTVYYVASFNMKAGDFASYVRGHWRIEAGHNSLDGDAFSEDRCTSRKGNSLQNLALLRKIVFFILSNAPFLDKQLTMPLKMLILNESKGRLKHLLFGDFIGSIRN